MARARSLKPGFFTDAELIECAHWVRLLFAGLWTIADREGRLLDRPKQIAVDLFPREDVDIESGLAQLAGRGLIVRYVAEGKALIWVRNFARHQNPHRDERASSLPAPPNPGEHGASTVQPSCEHGANRADSVNRTPDSLNTESKAPSRGHYPPEFARFWVSYPRTNGSKRSAYRAWSRLSRADQAAATAGVAKWRASQHWQRGYVVYAEKFLSQRKWEDEPVAPGENGLCAADDPEMAELIRVGLGEVPT